MVEVGVILEEGESSEGGFYVGVGTDVFPAGVRCQGQTDVSGFSDGVLASVSSTYLYVEIIVAVASGDGYGGVYDGS